MANLSKPFSRDIHDYMNESIEERKAAGKHVTATVFSVEFDENGVPVSRSSRLIGNFACQMAGLDMIINEAQKARKELLSKLERHGVEEEKSNPSSLLSDIKVTPEDNINDIIEKIINQKRNMESQSPLNGDEKDKLNRLFKEFKKRFGK